VTLDLLLVPAEHDLLLREGPRGRIPDTESLDELPDLALGSRLICLAVSLVGFVDQRAGSRG